MFTFLRKLENLYAAAAMAQGGEWESARMIAGTPVRTKRQETVGNVQQQRRRIRAVR